MKVYVLTFETFHDKGRLIGAYSSIERAISAAATWPASSDGWKAPPREAWSRAGFYVESDAWPHVVAQAEVHEGLNDVALIFELEIDE